MLEDNYLDRSLLYLLAIYVHPTPHRHSCNLANGLRSLCLEGIDLDLRYKEAVCLRLDTPNHHRSEEW